MYEVVKCVKPEKGYTSKIGGKVLKHNTRYRHQSQLKKSRSKFYNFGKKQFIARRTLNVRIGRNYGKRFRHHTHISKGAISRGEKIRDSQTIST